MALKNFLKNIDKGISFNDPSKVVVTKPVQKEEKKDDKDKKDKKEEKEERTVTITETSPPILKPTVITEEDEE